MPCKQTQLVDEHSFITSQHLPELNPSLFIPWNGWKTRYFSFIEQSQGVLRTNVQIRLLEAIHWKCESPVAFLTWAHYSRGCCVYSGALPFHPPLIYMSNPPCPDPRQEISFLFTSSHGDADTNLAQAWAAVWGWCFSHHLPHSGSTIYGFGL